MKVFSTTQLRRNTSEILEAVQCEPVLITRYGKSLFAMISREHFDAIATTLMHSLWMNFIHAGHLISESE
ncbi:Phd_YefM [Roseovarius albus]|uniref:Antitoxin n=1 Tax=Roseovarius albus TaxID=1247867 RepID=A0A1X6ZYT9_9RHOB|nr:Phd_YefM [Roseovarius albus]